MRFDVISQVILILNRVVKKMNNKSTFHEKVSLISTRCSQMADKHVVLLRKNFAASFSSHFPVETSDVFSCHPQKLPTVAARKIIFFVKGLVKSRMAATRPEIP